MAKLQRTKRPTREELAALLPELEALQVQPEEGEVLDRVVRKFDRWKVGGHDNCLRAAAPCCRACGRVTVCLQQCAGRDLPAAARTKRLW